VTTAEAPYRRRSSAVARGWRTFRRWRRGRPFWGALFTILSGIEYFYSGHITFGGIKITFVPQEFLGWLIPLLLLLCGALMLVTPSQRLFYGILAAAVAVAGLVGLNLGGFVVGMILGMIGGSLGASWTPVPLVSAVPSPTSMPPDHPEAGTSETDAAEEDAPGREAPDEEATAGQATDGVAPEGGSSWRRPGGYAAVVLLVLSVAVGVAVVRGPSPAVAAPACGTAATTASKSVPAASAAGTPSVGRSSTASSTAAASPTPGAGPVTKVINSVLTVLGDLLGTGADPQPTASATVSATPSATATPAPSATRPATPMPAPIRTPTRRPTPKPSATTGCPTARALIAPADQTKVATTPATQITANLSQTSLIYDGVTDLPTENGTIPVLEFSLASSTSTPFELRVPVGNRTLVLTSSQLAVAGNVRFYTNRLDGDLILLGLPVHQTYTPDSPPLLLPPGVPSPLNPLVFTNVTLQLVLVHADTLTAPDLNIAYAS
jgi:hypothetical protein